MYRKLVSGLVSSGVTCVHRRLLSTQLRILLGDKFTLPRVTAVIPHHINAYSTYNRNKLEAKTASEPDVLYSNVDVEVMGHDPSVLNSYEFFATEAAKLLDIPCESETPPRIIDRRTVLKSRHVHGKYHKVQYEARTHFKLIKLTKLTGSTADTYLEYIQRNLPEGTAMKVTKTRIEKIPEHIKRPEAASESAS